MSLGRVARLFRTVRHLRAEQIFFRLYYRVRSLQIPPSTVEPRRNWVKSWEAPEVMDASMTSGDTLRFFGESGSVRDLEVWNDPAKSKLWLYNLHYFDDLNAKSSEERIDWHKALIDRWISENPEFDGNGWEPYTLSLRIVNWVKWFSKTRISNERWNESLFRQASALAKQAEFHLLGNHLIANAKALIFAGSYFEGPRADVWLKNGLMLLEREIKEQFLSDGGHFEQSPMYHASLLWDLCDLVRLSEVTNHPLLGRQATAWRAVIERGLGWLSYMLHPDGEISFFNDAALGVAPRYDEISTYAAQLGCRVSQMASSQGAIVATPLANTGFVVLEAGGVCKAILDVGQIGPDCQPGHAHADSLSFEASFYSKRVFVNSGTSQYGDDAERQRQRSTSAHNTVEIDGENSSEVWGGFRVARRARPFAQELEHSGSSVRVVASHDGYRRLSGRNVHKREWVLGAESLTVSDFVSGSFGQAKARYYLHPDVAVEASDADSVTLRLSSGQALRVSFRGHARISVERATWHPFFGQSQPNFCIVASFNIDALCANIEWSNNLG